jgi:isopentenyldiphosphate isomerase
MSQILCLWRETRVEFFDVLDKKGSKTGKTKERGEPLEEGEYCRIVHVWIVNTNGEFLISKRTPSKKTDPDKWEPTRGWVIAGEESAVAAVREVDEELGITLNPDKGILIKSYISSTNDAIADVWLFHYDAPICDIDFSPADISEVKWATGESIKQQMAKGIFIRVNKYLPYMDDLLTFVESKHW